MSNAVEQQSTPDLKLSEGPLPWAADKFLGSFLSTGGKDLANYVFSQMGIGGSGDDSAALAKMEDALQETNKLLTQLGTDISNLEASLMDALQEVEANLTFQITSSDFAQNITSITGPWAQLQTYFASVDAAQWSSDAKYRATMQTVYQETITKYVDLATMNSAMEWIASQMQINPLNPYADVYYQQIVNQWMLNQYVSDATGKRSIDYSTIAAVQQNAYAGLHGTYAYVTTIQAQGLYLQWAYITATESDPDVMQKMIDNATTTFFQENAADWMAFMRAVEEVSMLSNGYYTDHIALGNNVTAPLYGSGFDQIRTWANQVRCAGSGFGNCLTVELIVPWEETQAFDKSAWSTSAADLTLAYSFTGAAGKSSTGAVQSRLMVDEAEWSTAPLSYTFDGATTRQYWSGTWNTVSYVPRLVFDVPIPDGAVFASFSITAPDPLATSYASGLTATLIPVSLLGGEGGATYVQSSPNRYGAQMFYGVQSISADSTHGAPDLTGFTLSQGLFPGAGTSITYKHKAEDKWSVSNFNKGAWCLPWQLQPPAAHGTVLGNALIFEAAYKDGSGGKEPFSVYVDSMFDWDGATWWGQSIGGHPVFVMVTSVFAAGATPTAYGTSNGCTLMSFVFINQTSDAYTLALSDDQTGTHFIWPQPAQPSYVIPANGQLVGLKVIGVADSASINVEIDSGAQKHLFRVENTNLNEQTVIIPSTDTNIKATVVKADSVPTWLINVTIQSGQ